MSCWSVSIVDVVRRQFPAAEHVDPVASVTLKGTKASIAEAMIRSISSDVEAFFADFLLFFGNFPPPSVPLT